VSIPATAPQTLPDLARLRPRQQMAMDCALCARRLGASGRQLGEIPGSAVPALGLRSPLPGRQIDYPDQLRKGMSFHGVAVDHR
jgi:hypothetical protein